MELRAYREDDLPDVVRIYRECGWFVGKKPAVVASFLEDCSGVVATTDGTIDGMAFGSVGAIRYLDSELPVHLVTGVNTGLLARRQGIASRATARIVADRAADGVPVALLGIFDQGFYDKLGFATGPTEVVHSFDPRQLRVRRPRTRPRRLAPSDWPAIHTSRHRRMRGHGSCQFLPGLTKGECLLRSGFTGFGFDDPDGTLGWHLVMSAKDVEEGPYIVAWMAYRNRDELLDLLGVLSSMGDQVLNMRLLEQSDLMVQDLLHEPFRQHGLTRGGSHAVRARAAAWWQVRITNLETCIAATRLPGEVVRFNLVLSDPIGKYLREHSWQGIGGKYLVELGPTSVARAGAADGLPTLSASVGAFTRLWLGVAGPQALALTDDFNGPPELLDALTRVVRIPTPHPDWDF
jgi:hypothetical protein